MYSRLFDHRVPGYKIVVHSLDFRCIRDCLIIEYPVHTIVVFCARLYIRGASLRYKQVLCMRSDTSVVRGDSETEVELRLLTVGWMEWMLPCPAGG